MRKGAPKAVMALAHHMIAIVYNTLARGEEYVELGGDYYDQRNKPRVVSRLVARLTRLGYYVSLKPVEPESSYEPSTVMELSLPQPRPAIPASHNPLSMPDSVALPAPGEADHASASSEELFVSTPPLQGSTL